MQLLKNLDSSIGGTVSLREHSYSEGLAMSLPSCHLRVLFMSLQHSL